MRGPTVHFSRVNLNLGGTRILEDVTFSIAPGEIHALVGPNGGGKTSLVRSLLGEMPHEGEITIAWQESTILGYVPQALDLDRTLPISVADFMAMISQRRPAFLGMNRQVRESSQHALQRVGLENKSRRKLGDLSGGERQRLMLAQALMPAPALLVLDEPAAGMDEAGETLLERLLVESAQAGTTVLWIAHDLGQVRRIAHGVTCLNRTVQFHGRATELLTNERVRAAFGLQALRAQEVAELTP